MKAQDLMIGDWISYGVKPVQVLQLSDTEYKGFEPIPLTSEILEENADGGWCNYQSEPEGRSIYHIGKVAVYVEWERIVPSPYIELHGLGDTFFKGYVNYVHELQHALRLCGIEKEIEL